MISEVIFTRLNKLTRPSVVSVSSVGSDTPTVIGGFQQRVYISVSVLTVVSCSRQYEVLTVVSCSRQYEGEEPSIPITIKELPQTTLTLEHPFPEIFTGETVTLRCGVEGGSAGWKYLWYKDSEDTPVLQTAGRSITGDSYTITAAAVSDQGQYCCRGQRKKGHPQAVLTLQPAWSQIFTGETVTLSCEVEGGSTDWRFKQYRDGREEAGCGDLYRTRNGDSCTISKARHAHSGVYWCESASGQERSNAVNLTPSYGRVILQTPPQPVIEGDSLTLRCLVRDGYKATRVIFYKYNRELQSWAGKELSVDHVSKSDEGFYKCKAWWWWDSSPYSGDSAEVRVSVRELPKAVLTSSPQWGELYTGETVTLSCGVEGGFTGFQYLWYKSSQGVTVQIRGTTGARYTLSPVTQSHSGQYQCEAQRGDPPRSSQSSDPITLTVSEGRPKSVLTREPAGEIFEGDTVTLSCVVEGGSGGWRYLWYKDRQGAPVYQTDSSSGTGAGYTISAAALSHSGEYWCGAGRGRNTSYSQYSDPIWVNVTALSCLSLLLCTCSMCSTIMPVLAAVHLLHVQHYHACPCFCAPAPCAALSCLSLLLCSCSMCSTIMPVLAAVLLLHVQHYHACPCFCAPAPCAALSCLSLLLCTCSMCSTIMPVLAAVHLLHVQHYHACPCCCAPAPCAALLPCFHCGPGWCWPALTGPGQRVSVS
ncbi:UNVERIFIED_CONTAM: hypothetical protein FKN15_005185 [Acipenser sinensis]